MRRRKALIQLDKVEVDWDLSLKLLRTLSFQPKKRTMLEVVFADGMFTATRYNKHLDGKEQKCPFGCPEQDPTYHRYWGCRRWRVQRSKLSFSVSDLHPLTASVGLIPVRSGLDFGEVCAIQVWMAMTVSESSEAHHHKLREEPMHKTYVRGNKVVDQDAGHLAYCNDATLAVAPGGGDDNGCFPSSPLSAR